MIWRRDWKLKGNFSIRMEATYRGQVTTKGEASWRQTQEEYGMLGICFGGRSLHESWYGRNRWIGYGERLFTEFNQWNGEKGEGDATWMSCWRSHGVFGIYDHATDQPDPAQHGSEQVAGALKPGEKVQITVDVEGTDKNMATVKATLKTGEGNTIVTCTDVDRAKFVEGYFGLVGRGLLDWEVNRIQLEPRRNNPLKTPVNACHTCYALGETLKQVKGKWQCNFVSVFRHSGKKSEIRIAAEPDPPEGWENVPVTGYHFK